MRYAIIENNTVTNIVEADEEFAKTQGWINVHNIFCDIGWLYDGKNFAPDPELERLKEEIRIENLKNEIRQLRDSLLAATDFWLLPDRTVTQAQLDYRQALRDIPQQEGFPENVIWPEKP